MTAREPSAVEVLAGAIGRRDTGLPLDARSGLDRAALLDISDVALAALKAAGFVVATRDEIRAMSPEQQAELIGGEVEYTIAMEHFVPSPVDPSHGVVFAANGIGRWVPSPREGRVIGPWREVQA